MKTTGIVRRIDELGRIVLPVELRRTLGIDVKDQIEILIEGNKIILRKYEDSCIFCGGKDNLVSYAGKNVCKDCIKELGK